MAVAESGADTEVKRIGLFSQLVRFVAIGSACAVVDSGIYAFLLSMGWLVVLAKTIAFVAGTSASYVINRKFTFSGASTGNARAKMGAFALVYIVTLGINVGVNQLLLMSLSGFVPSDQLRYAACWIIAQGVSTLINFGMLKWVIFRD